MLAQTALIHTLRPLAPLWKKRPMGYYDSPVNVQEYIEMDDSFYVVMRRQLTPSQEE